MNEPSKLSVIVPVTERYDDVKELLAEYREAIATVEYAVEFIYVLDGDYPVVRDGLEELRAQGEQITVVQLGKSFGEATALSVGFEHASGDVIATLPAYSQVKSNEIRKLFQALADGQDMVIGRRWPRDDSFINRTQSKVFNALIQRMVKSPAHDIGCGVRVFNRQVIEEIPLYGDLHRFLPILAHERGFKVREVDVAQSENDKFQRVHPLGAYVRRILDLLAVFFLIKFTKKPLRFFGLLGTGISSVGVLATLFLVSERLFFAVSLADRPALILSSLIVVLGIQLIAIGLIGEIVIFTHARELKEYTVEEVIN